MVATARRRMPHASRIALTLSAALVVILFAACAAAPTQSKGATDDAAYGRAGGPANALLESATGGAPLAPAAAPAPQPTNAAMATAVPGQPTIQQKIIYNGTLALTVADADKTVSRIAEIATSLGGLVVSSSVTESSGGRGGTAVIRVPADKFDAALDQIRPLASQVTKETRTTQDVTEEYYDQDARVRALQAQEEAYYKLLAQAKSVDEVLKVNQALSGVRVQIEQSQARMRVIDRTSAMATITISVMTASASNPVVSGWNLPDEVTDALRSSLAGLQATATIAIRILAFFWLWGPILAIVVFVRARRRRGRAPNPPISPTAAPGGATAQPGV